MVEKVIKKIGKKLIKEIPEIFKVQVSEYDNGMNINFADRDGELYEDTIWIGKAGDFLIEEDKELFEDVIDFNDLIISVDLWLKSFTKMNREHTKIIRDLVDKYASEYNLRKLFAYGMDDGGIVLFKDGIAERSYYYSRGVVDIDPSWAPKSEEGYWKHINEIIEE